MIGPEAFHRFLVSQSLDFYCGVPDSLLKNLCSHWQSRLPENRHVITANEGSALSLAAGYYLAEGKPGVVYLQNSGLGNLVNPLLSLVDGGVYSIPCVLLIGWRGEIDGEGKQLKDEPQHQTQGRLTLPLLETMDVPYAVLSAEDSDFQSKLSPLLERCRQESRPVAVVVRKNAFSEVADPPTAGEASGASGAKLGREEAIGIIAEGLPAQMPVVATTGMISRELFEARERSGPSGDSDFLTVGSMGHASQIALGISLARPELPVVCLDGDGSVLMHMGGLSNVADARRFFHVILNNGCHDSVGGQPTRGFRVDFPEIAKRSGYANLFKIATLEGLERFLRQIPELQGATLAEVKVKKGHRNDLGRPTVSPERAKRRFMEFLRKIPKK